MVETRSFTFRADSRCPAERTRQREHDEPAPRVTELYLCPQGHEFEPTFAWDVATEVPDTWSCRQHGAESRRSDAPPPKTPKPPRTHWDMLLERRSIPALEELLDERLADLARSRKAGVKAQPAPKGTTPGRQHA